MHVTGGDDVAGGKMYISVQLRKTIPGGVVGGGEVAGASEKNSSALKNLITSLDMAYQW